MIVLGCHLKDIQTKRILTAIDFSKNNESLTWFLTGGVKYAITSAISEADDMKQFLLLESNVIIDTDAKNTAENFLNFKNWYKLANFTEQPQIVITTSSFHKNRAEKIFKGIFHDIEIDPLWNLSQFACPSCWSDELIHMKNVDLDVKKALEKQII